ncbi:YajG family lipoprotein [Thaumasiovibrio subtropicus]|uniref:YajG family lipoprotein n=1 Tax=Thaumasiovibrio subtropicus TaxID=1891207 RepID=UPI000B359CA2|nr:YajG family lipoprotein [Thaumasiovibrio subtropicus]
MIKKLVLTLGLAVLITACSAPREPQLNLTLQPYSGASSMGQGTAISLETQDLRSAQFIALVDTGREQKQPVHAQQNLRVAFEQALTRQLTAQGYVVSDNSRGTMRVDILDTLLNVRHSVMKHEMEATANVQVVVESPRGKFVKRFTGRSSASGMTSASVEDMEVIVNDLLNNVLAEIGNDRELNVYILENL